MQLAQGDSEGERAGRLNTLIPLPSYFISIGQRQQEARVAERTLMLQVTYWGIGLGEKRGVGLKRQMVDIQYCGSAPVPHSPTGSTPLRPQGEANQVLSKRQELGSTPMTISWC